jgi:hypothetical protein
LNAIAYSAAAALTFRVRPCSTVTSQHVFHGDRLACVEAPDGTRAVEGRAARRGPSPSPAASRSPVSAPPQHPDRQPENRDMLVPQNTPFLSPRNVPLWFCLGYLLAIAGMIAWAP